MKSHNLLSSHHRLPSLQATTFQPPYMTALRVPQSFVMQENIDTVVLAGDYWLRLLSLLFELAFSRA